jgi:hypothetical protein
LTAGRRLLVAGTLVSVLEAGLEVLGLDDAGTLDRLPDAPEPQVGVTGA